MCVCVWAFPLQIQEQERGQGRGQDKPWLEPQHPPPADPQQYRAGRIRRIGVHAPKPQPPSSSSPSVPSSETARRGKAGAATHSSSQGEGEGELTRKRAHTIEWGQHRWTPGAAQQRAAGGLDASDEFSAHLRECVHVHVYVCACVWMCVYL